MPVERITPEGVEKAASALMKRRPEYGPMLDFYAKVFMAQEAAMEGVSPGAPEVDGHVLKTRADNGFPLVELREFPLDVASARALFSRICDIAISEETQFAPWARVLREDPPTRERFIALCRAMLKEDDEGFVEIAEAIGVDTEALAFFIYSAMKPSVMAGGGTAAAQLPAAEIRTTGVCPVCGSPPGISTLEGEGDRHFHCTFCAYRWRGPRIFCPFCDTKSQKQLRYFFADDEPEYRVQVCDRCNGYIKTIDTRKTDRIIYPPLERIATLHLDIKAREQGFSDRTAVRTTP